MKPKFARSEKSARAGKVRVRLVPYALRLYPEDVKRLEALAGRVPLVPTAIARELIHSMLPVVEADPARFMGGGSAGTSAALTKEERIRRCKGIFKHIAPGVSLANELIRDRREEARREAEE